MSTELLKKVYLFDGLTMPELVAVLKVSRQETFEEGRFVFLEGDPGGSCYIIEEGEVGISKYVPSAGEEPLAVLKAGSFFGEMSLIDGAARSATAVANSRTVCLVIDRLELERLIDGDREIGNKILRAFCRTLAARLRDTNEKIANFIAASMGVGWHV